MGDGVTCGVCLPAIGWVGAGGADGLKLAEILRLKLSSWQLLEVAVSCLAAAVLLRAWQCSRVKANLRVATARRGRLCSPSGFAERGWKALFTLV